MNTSSTTTPVSTGERLYSRQEFLPALQAGSAVAQPDLSHAGGITECRRIAELKDRYPSRLALHHVLSREQRTAPLLSGRIGCA